MFEGARGNSLFIRLFFSLFKIGIFKAPPSKWWFDYLREFPAPTWSLAEL